MSATDEDPVSNLQMISNIPRTPFIIEPVSIVEVREIIMSMKNKHSKDIYGCTASLIKMLANLIACPLTKLINLIFEESTFPTALKHALVIPVFKKGSRDELSNYRPISVLPIISKVVEKAITVRITKFFEDNEIFTKSQFGFRRNLSTTSAILDFVNNILNAYSDRKYASAVFCDLSKAFDCVCHGILLEKLRKYNFHPSSLALITSYLDNRSQIVRVGGLDSSTHTVKAGIPQGSVLGPVLFIIYINDLPYCDQNPTYQIFADDTTFTSISSSHEEALQGSCQAQARANKWFASNKLYLNESKTQRLVFSLRNMPDGPRDCVRFLGVRIDQGLVWDAHVDGVCEKLSQNIFALRNLSDCVPRRVLRSAYFSLCHSHLQYGILIWGHASCASRVFGLQRRAVRILAALGYRDECRYAFISNRVLTFPSVYIYENVLYVKKNLNEYEVHSDIHSHSTRNRDLLRPKYHRLGRCQDGPGYWAVHCFNRLPNHIKMLPFDIFKRVVRGFLVKRAYYSVQEYLGDNLVLGMAL